MPHHRSSQIYSATKRKACLKAKTTPGPDGTPIWDYTLRVQRDDGTWAECRVAHGELALTIDDLDAYVYEEDDRAVLDYSTETITGGKPPPK